MTDIQKFDIIETANPVLTVAPIEEETEMIGATVSTGLAGSIISNFCVFVIDVPLTHL